MIRKLRRKFILIAMTALTLVMVLLAGIVNLVNWISVRNELKDTLTFLTESEGTFMRDKPGDRLEGKPRHTRSTVSEAAWFAVFYDAEGRIRSLNLQNMTDADEDTASALALQAYQSGKTEGFLQDYLYRIRTEGPSGKPMAVFLDCETRLAAVRSLALISVLTCVGGILLAFGIVVLASGRVIRPMLKNMEQQKRFITDASHELKTPLTIISANMDLLEPELKGNQWIRSTRKQVSQMSRLVEELVYLSRLEEENAPLQTEPLELRPLTEETAEPFAAMAEYHGQKLTVRIDGDPVIRGDRSGIQRLISVLCDNAVKYAVPDSTILLTVRPEGRNVILSVSNRTARPLSKEECDRMFDRFYRADPSRNKEKLKGFGIGLAIAAALAEKHGGSIRADMEDEDWLCITCRLPKAD